MSVRWKLLAVVGAVLAVSLTSFFWLQYRQTRRDLIARVGLSAAPLTDIIASSLKYAMQTRNLEHLREIVRNVSMQKGVTHIMVLDKQGRVRVSSNPKDLGRVIDIKQPECQVCHRYRPEQRSHTRLLTTSVGTPIYRNVRPIVNEPVCHRCHDPRNKINGVLITDFSMSGVQQDLSDRGRAMLLTLLLSLLVTTATIGLLMNRLVIRRLHWLVAATRSVAHGDLDQQVPDSGGDEVGQLGASFNEMVAGLRRARVVRERKEMIEHVLDAVRESILVVDADGRVLSASRGTRRMFGYGPEALVGRIYAEVDTARALLWEQIAGGRSLGTEQEMVRASGETFPARVRLRPLRTEQEELLGYVEITYDLTAERAREELKQQLAESEKLAGIGLLASGVAHEINNPMTSIATYAEALLDRVAGLPEEEVNRLDPKHRLHDYLRVIHEEAFRCKAITQNLLDYARPRQVHFRPVSLQDLVRSAVDLERGRLESQGIRLSVQLPAQLPELMADPDQLRSALLNLVRNAMDAMPNGGGLTIAVEKGDGEVVLRVSDEGCGIPREHLARIFDPFFSTKTSARGTGLGLSLCHQAMQKHGGRVSVESEPGAGTTFRLHLPYPGPMTREEA